MGIKCSAEVGGGQNRLKAEKCVRAALKMEQEPQGAVGIFWRWNRNPRRCPGSSGDILGAFARASSECSQQIAFPDKQIGFGASWESLEDFQQKIRWAEKWQQIHEVEIMKVNPGAVWFPLLTLFSNRIFCTMNCGSAAHAARVSLSAQIIKGEKRNPGLVDGLGKN